MVQQIVGERGKREDIGRADERGQTEGYRAPARVLALELARRGHGEADQQRPLERRQEPRGADRQALGQRQLQGDRGQHGGKRRQHRLGGGRWRIWPAGNG